MRPAIVPEAIFPDYELTDHPCPGLRENQER